MKPVKFFLMLPVTFIGLLVVTLIFTVLNKAFWDARVRYLCANEAGFSIFERVNLEAPEYENLVTGIGGFPSLRLEENISATDPFCLSTTTVQNQKVGGITIAVFRQSIVRRSDGKVLSTRVSYSRRGGDLTTFGGPGSSFSCEDINSDIALEFLAHTFNFQGE